MCTSNLVTAERAVGIYQVADRGQSPTVELPYDSKPFRASIVVLFARTGCLFGDLTIMQYQIPIRLVKNNYHTALGRLWQ